MSFKKSAALIAISFAIFGAIFGAVATAGGFFGLELQHVSFIIAIVFLIWIIFAVSLVSHYENRLATIEKMAHDTIHEIATPTATIKANSKMLRAGNMDEKGLRRLERIELSAKRLEELYASLEWRIKNDFTANQSEIINVADECAECVAYFEQAASDKDVVFDIDIEPLSAKLDRYGLRLAISNIIDNAVKYSAKNTAIHISLKNGALSVSNSGKTLEANELIGIYDRYFRAQSDKNGYGIGLDIVKNFCDTNGVVVKIESEQNLTKVTLVFNKI